jgi:hypothetical protein
VFYEGGEDHVTRRAAFRDAHLEKAWKVSRRAKLLLGGAFANPVDGAVLLFQGNPPGSERSLPRPILMWQAARSSGGMSGNGRRWQGQTLAAPVGPKCAGK